MIKEIIIVLILGLTFMVIGAMVEYKYDLIFDLLKYQLDK
jgi:hypothetical protein